METKKVAIIGATGYAGMEAVKLSLSHPAIELVAATSRNDAGERLSKLFGPNGPDMEFCTSDSDEVKNAEVIFSCLPHCTAAKRVKEWHSEGKIVIDLSADFRLKSASVFKKWYGKKHEAEELLEKAVYGLPEINRDKIKDAEIIAVPGCYPTATILGLLPAIKNDMVEPVVIANAVSGVSGAGRQASEAFSFCEVNQSMKGYGTPTHRHTPEMEQALSGFSGAKIKVSFVPHLGSFNRGIYATLYGKLENSFSQEEMEETYKEFYKNEPFVTICNANPKLSDVQSTNHCHIKPVVDDRTGQLIVFSAIDNLLKGAAGQALQCFNIRFGLDETTGL